MSKHSDIWDKIYSDTTAKTMLFASIVYVIVVASFGWNFMLSHLYAFRETQTAISVSYLLKGGPWLAYETPVFGPPWSVPLEFPLYQWVVALVAKSGLFAVNQAGRFVSELFFFLSLYPLFKILGIFKFSNRQRCLILVMFCISPQYLFWSRSFMIESTALALSIYYLWLAILICEQFASNRFNWLTVTGVAVVGGLAGMVKATTFFSFLVGGCLVIVVYAFRKLRDDGIYKKSACELCVVIFSAVILPLLAVATWTAYADSIKALNPLGVSWMSINLKSWTFGTLAQKLSMGTWQKFYTVTLSDLVGSSHVAAVAIIAVCLCSKKRIWISLVCLGLFLLTLLTFTNLHYVHTYYSYANGIFLIVAIGVIVTDLLECRNVLKRTIGATLLCLIIFFCIHNYFSGLWKWQNQDFDFSTITAAVDANSTENDVFIIFGTKGSPEIPYYINRRVVSITNGDFRDPALTALKERLKGYRIGGLLFYSRNGFGHLDKEYFAITYDFAKFFQVTPGYNSVYPWYKSGSEMFILFNARQ